MRASRQGPARPRTAGRGHRHRLELGAARRLRGADARPTPIFNEKVLAGLGRQVQTTGLLAAGGGREGARRAQALPRALRHACSVRRLWVHRHRRLPRRRERRGLHRRGRAHLPHARSTCCPAQREAQSDRARRRLRHSTSRTASSATSAAARSNWSTSTARSVRHGLTLPLGGLALQDVAGKSLKKAEKIVEDALDGLDAAQARRGPHLLRRRRHLARAGAAAHVADRLSAPRHARLRHPGARGARVLPPGAPGRSPRRCRKIEVVNAARRPLLAYAALVLEHIVRAIASRARWWSRRSACARACSIRCSAREERARDPLLAAAARTQPAALALAAARRGADRLDRPASWRRPASTRTAEERRLRHAACLLADIGWRAHPDYRGEQSLNIIAHARLRRASTIPAAPIWRSRFSSATSG